MFYGFVGVWVRQPARTALNNGCEGVAAINTITSVMGINLDTLRPEPCVEGYLSPRISSLMLFYLVSGHFTCF
jgi:hypothetical protein